MTWQNSRVLRALDPRGIEAMKQRPRKDMMSFGSGSIVSKLSEHGLIDAYQFAGCPILIGSDRALFSGVSKRWSLKLLDAKPLRSGNVIPRYSRTG